MPRSPLLAKKYARALFDATKGKADLSSIEARLPSVSTDLRKPTISLTEVAALLGNPTGVEINNLLSILVRRKRHVILSEIIEAYRLFQEEAAGIGRASVTLATAPSATTKDKIALAAASILGSKTVKLDVAIDATILGGMMLRCGDQLIDGSISTKLEAFQSKF